MSSSSTSSDRHSAPTRLRAAELADLDALVAIENRCFDTDRLSRRSFRHLLTRGRAATLVAEHGGAVVGYVLVLFSHGTLHARIYSLAVDPAARGLGLGRDLVEAAEDAAKDQECSEIRLEVRKDNEEAIGLYESLGYRRFGVLAGYYEDHGDALRYRKSLAPQLGLDMVRVPYYAQTTDFTCGPAALMMAMGALEQDSPVALDRKLELRLWREATTIFMMAGHGGCGPHGLALSAWHRGFGVEVFVSDRRPILLDSVRSPEKKEVMRLVQEDMIEELAAHGVPIHHRAVQPDELAAFFARGGIPVVLISSYRIYREKFPHWVVVTGFDSRYVYVHDPFVDEEEGESIADCINMPIPRREFEAMSRYGRANQRAAVVIYPQREGEAAGD
jgi:ribosomal-protein-alanine acetyltransferase